MATGQLGTVVHYLRRLVVERAVAEQSDGELLGRFHERQEADAFAALVRRHGPMVLSVCRRVLGDVHHAEDAFQATFLVLVRKSGAIRKRHSLGSWLHGVAYRIAVRARIGASQRRLQALDPAQEPATQDDDQAAWRELRRVLDEELCELPEKYRQPLVLCYLEGKTNEEAARLLGCTKGTVSGRLARARDLLRSRLIRRGLTLAACGVALLETDLTAQALVPLALESSTIQLATLVAAGDLAAAGAVGVLTEGVIQSMTFSKVKFAAAALLVVGLLGSSAGIVGYQAFGQPPGRVIDLGPGTATTEGDVDPVVIARLKDTEIRSLAVSPNAEALAIAGSDNVVHLVELATGRQRLALRGHTEPVLSLAFSPDGRRLASAAEDRTVRIWEVEGQKTLLSLLEPQPITSLAFSPDGRTLVSGSSSADKGSGLVLWDAATGKKLREFIRPEDRVRQVFFSPDGTLLITGTSAGPIRLWDVGTGKEVRTLQAQEAGRTIAVSPDGKIIAAGGNQRIMLLELATGKLLSTLQFEKQKTAALSLVFSPDAKFLAVEHTDGVVDVMDVPLGKLHLTLKPQSGPVVALLFTPDGQNLVTAGQDGTVRQWKLEKVRATVQAGELLARLNSAGVPARLQSLIAELVKSQRSDEQLAEAVCLATLSRLPTETERRFMTDHLAKQKDRRQEALTDVVWALINTKEFDAHVGELTRGGWGQRSIRDPERNPAKP